MKKAILPFLVLLPFLSFGQYPLSAKAEPTGEPYVHYYNFYNGLQMIELDYLTAYHQRVNYLEQAKPRALTWEMVLGPPHPNVYLLRNEKGVIVKQYGECDLSKLRSVAESIQSARFHNSRESQAGTSLGFSSISTRYFPYYLVGSQPGTLPGSLGLIDSLGNVVLPQEYDVIWKHNNLFITRKDSLNEMRDIHLTSRFSSHEYQLQPAQTQMGYVDILKNEKCGLMDSTGKMVVPCKYDMLIEPFNELGLAKVTKKGMIGYVDKTGKEVIECKYQSAGVFKEGLLDVRLDEKWGYVDANGKTVIPHKYEVGIWFEEGRARVARREDGQFYFGFIDKDGKEVIPLIYSNAKDFKDGVAEVMFEGKWIRIDRNGNRL